MTTTPQTDTTHSDPMVRQDYQLRCANALDVVARQFDVIEACAAKGGLHDGHMVALQGLKARADRLLADYWERVKA